MPNQTYARVLWFGLCIATTAAVAEPSRDELRALRAKAAELKAELEGALSDRGEEQAGLERLEVALGRTTRELVSLNRHRAELTRQREAAARRLGALTRRVEVEQGRADLLARATVAVGRERGLAAVLGGADQASAGRALAYLAYLRTATASRLRAVAEDRRTLAALRAELGRQADTFERLIDDTRRARTAIETRRADRARLLARLNLRIQDRHEKLARLRRDARRLEQLVNRLAPRMTGSRLESGPVESISKASFETQRGRMAWPVRGGLRHRFGAPRQGSDLAWAGLWIDAPPGTAVKAISHGRVAFSDWFRGFGLLLIIDHGDGYMSLYGHNQTLLKDTGTWVDRADVIARIGDTGGLARSSLYFEVRHDGVPMDPVPWLTGRRLAESERDRYAEPRNAPAPRR